MSSSPGPIDSPLLLKILLLEDNPSDQVLIQKKLLSLDIPVQIETVSERFDFVRSLLDFVPDLILSDFYLGPFNGLEALILVKNTYPNVPFIILTDETDERKITSWYDQGISACLSKSELKRLPETIEEAQVRNTKYAHDALRLRVMKQLRNQLQEIMRIEANTVHHLSIPSSAENYSAIQGLSEVSQTITRLYRTLRKHAPIK